MRLNMSICLLKLRFILQSSRAGVDVGEIVENFCIGRFGHARSGGGKICCPVPGASIGVLFERHARHAFAALCLGCFRVPVLAVRS